jgi:hypothetical protein
MTRIQRTDLPAHKRGASAPPPSCGIDSGVFTGGRPHERLAPGAATSKEGISHDQHRLKTIISIFAGVALAGGGTMPAQAATQVQDGLVNVAVGDVSVLNDSTIGVAAQVAAEVCGLKVGPVSVLGRAVDRSGETRTVCTTDQGPVTISNN